MSIQPVILWSDFLIYGLMISLCFFVYSVSHNNQIKQRWLKVFSSSTATLSFIIILFYILIALLDSLHFRRALPVSDSTVSNQEVEMIHYSHEVESTLDWVLADLKNNSEKTYSSPFSVSSFSKENQQDEQGRTYRDFPRLEHAGVHLNSPKERGTDVIWRTIKAIVWGLVIGGILVFVLSQWRQRSASQLPLPWKTIYATLMALSVITCWILKLGAVYHILGTDKVGTDVLYQSIKAVRTGILIGSLSTLLTLPFAIGLGISAGYFKGRVDDMIQFIYTTLSSVPDILLIAAAVLVLDVYIDARAEQFQLLIERADFKFLTLCFILGITSWTGLCRLLRAETLKVSQLDYVAAARAFGVGHAGILFKHILPNVMHLVLISSVLSFSGVVLVEAILSYIGVGVDASMMSWGNMINAARQELSRDPVVWWSISAAFVWMFCLVLAVNLFADQVREAFDPRVYQEGDEA